LIVLDTTVLVYAVGDDHTLREPARSLVQAIEDGTAQATTSVEAIQEFVHVRARRRDRSDAAALGRAYATLLSPLLQPTEGDLADGLRLVEREERLGPFDAVLAATAIAAKADALVSADSTFDGIRGLRWVDLAGPDVELLTR
jgi:predicted nucleic acid-binding protein